MLAFINRLAQKWTAWVGDRDMELALRKHFEGKGFYGDSAEFQELKLAAVQRPGWLQVFLFTVLAKSKHSGDKVLLYGIIKQDERYNRSDIRIFSGQRERYELFLQWSDGLIKTRRQR